METYQVLLFCGLTLLLVLLMLVLTKRETIKRLNKSRLLNESTLELIKVNHRKNLETYSRKLSDLTKKVSSMQQANSIVMELKQKLIESIDLQNKNSRELMTQAVKNMELAKVLINGNEVFEETSKEMFLYIESIENLVGLDNKKVVKEMKRINEEKK